MRKKPQRLILLLLCLAVVQIIYAQDGPEEQRKGALIYAQSMSDKKELGEWIMEGPGKIECRQGWMHMHSPGEEGHHVFWCPEDFPESFLAQWELQNMETDAGLCIVFFAAEGNKGESIFEPSFPDRNGVFRQYTKSKFFHNYHISYYANGKDNPGRELANLRKNKGFHKVQTGKAGIPEKSEDKHRITLIKDGSQILMYVDDRKIIDWTDDGRKYGPVWTSGKIGLRQMKWTHFRYRDFKVWALKK
jgi:hypothetical protein